MQCKHFLIETGSQCQDCGKVIHRNKLGREVPDSQEILEICSQGMAQLLATLSEAGLTLEELQAYMKIIDKTES